MNLGSSTAESRSVNDWALQNGIDPNRAATILGCHVHSKVASIHPHVLEGLAAQTASEGTLSKTSDMTEELAEAARYTEEHHSWFPYFPADKTLHPPLYGSEHGPPASARQYRRTN